MAPLSHAASGLCGAYFAPAGAAPQAFDYDDVVLYRTDPVINFDWATGSPGFPVPPDDFMVRWTGTITPAFSQTYTFYTTSDDGVRLWVNDILIIDEWTQHAVQTDSGSIALTAGVPVSIRMELFERGVYAVARLEWQSPSQPRQVVPSASLSTPPCVAPTPTTTPTASPTATHSPTATATPTSSPTPTQTQTFTNSPTYTVTPTITLTHTITPTFSITPTFTASPVFKLTKPLEIRAIYPNPSEGAVKVFFMMEAYAPVKAVVYNVAGELIYKDALDGAYGPNVWVWDGTNQEGALVASGIYLIVMEAVTRGGAEVDTGYASILR